uniref:WW domain binding protein 11 n=1 Tax=Paramormyrops kingsleyae TaxID=1676925 RepID=A0A3B3SF19_9TELE
PPPPRTGPPRPMAPPLSLFPPPLNPNVLSAPPSIKRANITSLSAAGGPAGLGGGPATGGATISAKPQIINPKAEVTRFVPTALRVRRERGGAMGVDKGGRKSGEDGLSGQKQQQLLGVSTGSGNPGQVGSLAGAGSVSQASMQTKDQVYEAFMREMEGLL